MLETIAPLIVALAFFAHLIISVYRKPSTNPRKLPLPPGPKPLPFIGNVLDLMDHGAWLKYTQWQRSFGDIIHVQAFGQHIVILNSHRIARDLLDKRPVYSGRPVLPMAGELMGWSQSTPMLGYNETWRKHRKLIHPIMTKAGSRQFYPLIEKESALYLRRLLKEPHAFIEHFHLTAARQMMKMTYGIEVDSLDDELITTAEKAIEILLFSTVPGAFLVDVFPLLRYVPSWFPGAGFQNYAAKGRALLAKSVREPFDICKKQVNDGVPNSSFTADWLRAEKSGISTEDYEKIVEWTSGTIYSAGSDTTVSAVHTFVLAMVLHPSVQRKAQAELDRLLGSRRVPNIADLKDLPYVECVIKEVLRWHPVAPLAFPHAVIEDDYYDGYYIPKDAIVMANVWAITRDASVYPEPDAFNPERFEIQDRKPTPLDPREYVFGFGRRKCAGYNFANDVLALTIASMLATLDMSKVDGEKVEESYTRGFVSHPEPFKCNIRPRSDAAAALIQGSPV